MLTWFIVEDLWISGNPEAWMAEALDEFDLIVLVSTEFQLHQYDHLAILRAPVGGGMECPLDGLVDSAACVSKALADGKKVLVSCSAGKNRSAAVAAIVLQQLHGMSPDESLAAVRAARGENAVRHQNLVELVTDIDIRGSDS